VVERFILERDRTGAGFDIIRVASEQSGKWRSKLFGDEARRAASVIAQFPISERYDLTV